MGLKPFFGYYGSKYLLAGKYPLPRGKVIEPFAGSAGYSLLHHDRDVLLCDLDEKVCGIWDYLINVSEEEILSIDDVEDGCSADSVAPCQEAGWLIGFWLGSALSEPKKTPSAWMRKYRHTNQGSFWSLRTRLRIAGQLRFIRHWRVKHCSYEDIENEEATWFVDPPYEERGVHYKHGSNGIDYGRLGEWCDGRLGSLIVCENEGASWLPFEPLTAGRSSIKGRVSMEVAYVKNAYGQIDMFTRSK